MVSPEEYFYYLKRAFRKNHIHGYKIDKKANRKTCIFMSEGKWIVAYVKRDLLINRKEYNNYDIWHACEDIIKRLSKSEEHRKKVWMDWATDANWAEKMDDPIIPFPVYSIGALKMRLEAIIVFVTRKALKLGGDLIIKSSECPENTRFVFMDGTVVDNIADWFSHCKDGNIVDIKLCSPKIEDQHLIDVAYETYDVVCFWKDRGATIFAKYNRQINDRNIYVYREEAFSPSEYLTDVEDNTERYMEVLSELHDFAIKIGYEAFNQRFDHAYKALDGKAMARPANLPYYLEEMPDKAVKMLYAWNISGVFGGMGWWNDDPRGKAESMGLDEEYRRLTSSLKLNMRKALLYVVNKSWERK